MINTKKTLNWLFDLNKNKTDFVNFIQTKNNNWSKVTSNLVLELRKNGAIGIQEKFKDLGFNINKAYVQLKARFCELEVGSFLIAKGEKIKFLEGQNSPDLISGIKNYDKVWEVSTTFGSPELKNLWIEGNKIINSWDFKVKVNIKLSLVFSDFRPKMSYHKRFETLINNSLKTLRDFDPECLKPSKKFELITPHIFYDLSLSDTNFSGISRIVEGGIDEMAHILLDDEINSWVNAFKSRIIKKSKQLINNINISEKSGNYDWDSYNYRLIAIVSDAEIFNYETYFIPSCFGSFNIHSTNHIKDIRLKNLNSSNPWYTYIKENCFDHYGNTLKEPKGTFLMPETEEIHGVLFVSSNRRPIKNEFLPNPFVLPNNNPCLINYLK